MPLLDGRGRYFAAYDLNGDPVSGAKLYVYPTGTLTPAVLYADADFATPLTEVPTANSSGIFSPGIYAADAVYDIDIKDANGVSVPGYPITGLSLIAATNTELTEALTGMTAQIAAAQHQVAIAEGHAQTALQAASASGPYTPYETKADLDAALSGLDEGDIVEVIADETRAGLSARYKVESGVAVFKTLRGDFRRVASHFNYLATVKANGDEVCVDGLYYKRDTTVSDTECCTIDLGVSGWVPSRTPTFDHYGVVGDGMVDDSAKITVALARGGYIEGRPDASYFVDETQFWITKSGTKINWNGATILTDIPGGTVDYEDESLLDAVLNFTGTTAELLEDCYSKNGNWVHQSTMPGLKAHKIIRCKDMIVSGHTLKGIQCDFWTHHPDAPMATSGVTRPDVAQDLTDYCNHGGYSGYNIGTGDDTKNPLTDTMVGIMTRIRWVVGVATVEHSEARYYRQGFTFRGGASDQDDDGPITDASGNYTEYWCHVRCIGLKAEYIERGGIWSTNAIMQCTDCYAYLCGDFGLHNEGGEMTAVNCRIKDSASGIGQFSFARWTAYYGCTVELTDHTIYNNSILFSHVNNLTGRTGAGTVQGCTFINRDATDGVLNTIGVISLQRDHIWTLKDNQYWNVRISADGTNHGKRYIENENFYLRGDLSSLPAFNLVTLGGIVTDGEDVGHCNNCTFDLSECTLPADCRGIHMYGGSDCQLEASGNKIISDGASELLYEISYADTASGGTKSFVIRDNLLTQGIIGCTSNNTRVLARAITSGNRLITGEGLEASTPPTIGVYRRGATGIYSDPATAGYEGWIATTAGGATKGAYSNTTAYTKADQVNVGSNVYYARTDVPADATGDSGPTGTNGTTFWHRIATQVVTFKGRGALEA